MYLLKHVDVQELLLTSIEEKYYGNKVIVTWPPPAARCLTPRMLFDPNVASKGMLFSLSIYHLSSGHSTLLNLTFASIKHKHSPHCLVVFINFLQDLQISYLCCAICFSTIIVLYILPMEANL
jgi:hypothetical protein